MRLNTTNDVANLRSTLQAQRPQGKTEVIISTDATCCILKGSQPVAQAFQKEIHKMGMEGTVQARLTGCLGFCEIEPIVIVKNHQQVLYARVKPDDVPEILTETVQQGKVVDRLLFQDPVTGEKEQNIEAMPFYQKQFRLLLGENEQVEPVTIDSYVANGGYAALVKVLETMTPEQVIEEVIASGLRGRGGGGFLTARKWRSCHNAKAEDGIRYVICNADEGDPGAYMDRSILEGNPHSVIEGMIIGSYAIGSNQGYVYVRAEYPLAVKHLLHALKEAEEYGFLGDNILGSGHSFRIKVAKGAGAFVCGESTALMLSLEGKVGEPRTKHIHTVESGLYDRPTNLNNVETWANVPHIINRGAEWYSTIGTEGSKGTKIFSLVGKINNTGLVEVPMGLTLREIIFDIGGGIPKGKRFKAVQTGGPSGGCIPESLLDLPVDFDELSKVGSMMGSGGMIVMDEDTCMVDVARYFMKFLVEESCGKCTPCREGLYQQYKILDRITNGEGHDGDIERLEELSETIMDASLCALGKTAPNPVLSTLKYFREEYSQHIKNKKCSAGVCKALFQFRISDEKCTGCMVCARKCPQDAIEGERKEVHHVIQEKCIKCGICFDVCRFDAVLKV